MGAIRQHSGCQVWFILIVSMEETVLIYGQLNRDLKVIVNDPKSVNLPQNVHFSS